MRSLWALSVLVLLSLAAIEPVAARELKVIQTHEAKSGDMVFIKLPGRPEHGYHWRLNPKMSDGLKFVSVKVVGWFMANESGNKSQMNVAIAAKNPGKALLAFDYYRIREGKYDTFTSVVEFVVRP